MQQIRLLDRQTPTHFKFRIMIATLSTREQEILQLIAYEHNTREMAGILNLSPHTVISHRRNLLESWVQKILLV